MAATQTTTAAARVAFDYPSFGLYQIARFCIVLATEMQSVAVGWQVYEITKRPLDLGLVGLSAISSGHFAIFGFGARCGSVRPAAAGCAVLRVVCGVFRRCCCLPRFEHTHSVYPIYAVLILIGVVRAFNGPVSRALLPQLVPEEHFPNAVAWASGVFRRRRFWGRRLAAWCMRRFAGRRRCTRWRWRRRWWRRFALIGSRLRHERRRVRASRSARQRFWRGFTTSGGRS